MNKTFINAVLLTIAAVGQIVLAILFYNPAGDELVINLDWGVFMLSAIFGWLPIFTFRKKGKVEGRGYIHTTILVDSGIYGIVRHPQYLAGILICVALSLITPHWLVIALGGIAAVIYYLDTCEEEKGSLEKFGAAYEHYRERVPRMNFLAGIVRAILRWRSSTRSG
ncbi:MAG: isoprenylcysteine carboxylmethyltransferase family protein [Anaerolineales bacterium]|nr:isoprenylcysteine carboxylmethyltransferase family protein [Anaerolineales bacterium]